MATLPAAFDASTVKPGGQLDPVPVGEYNVKIIESEMKPTSDGKGQYLALTLEIMDGEFAGRRLVDNLNLVNENAVAVQIAYGSLSAICHATNVIKITDTSELHNKPMLAKVKIENGRVGADGKSYDAQNRIKRYEKIEGANAPSAAGAYVPPTNVPPPQQQAAAPASAASGGSSGGWVPPGAPPPAQEIDYGTTYPMDAHKWADSNPNHDEAKKIIATRKVIVKAPAQAAGWNPPANPAASAASKPPWEK